jgi:hypothetical protein
VWNSKNFDCLAEYVDNEYTIHIDTDDPWEGKTLNHNEYKERLNYSFNSFPDLHFSIQTTVWYVMNIYWDMMSHDSLYLPYYMDYTFGTLKRVCNYRVICSDLETFVVEASLLVYDKIGYLTATPVEFTFVGTLCRGCGGPYCTPPGGCPPDGG